jgi:acylpyruvate hydrolase
MTTASPTTPQRATGAQQLLFVSYRGADDPEPLAGLLRDDHVVPLAALAGVPDDIVEACNQVDGSAAYLSRLAKIADEAQGVKLTDVTLYPPIADPEKIICLGLNYKAHADEAGLEPPPVPVFFAKFKNALAGANQAIRLPRVSTEVDFEGELAVIIGRPAKQVAVENALEYVAGYTVMNDVSARDLQLRTSQWMAGKTLDTFAPMGPGVVPRALIPDPQDLHIQTWVNGALVQDASTSAMVFGVAETIAFLSTILTLQPGDIIATGTPEGVGLAQDPPTFLRDGDVVEIAISGVGTIRNHVTTEE